MYLFIRVCRKHLSAWQQMRVLLARRYVKILFRLVVSTMVLKVETKCLKEVLKEEIRLESAVLIC